MILRRLLSFIRDPDYGRDPAFVLRTEPASGLGPSGFNPAQGAVSCRWCGASVELDEGHIIFAHNIGYSDPTQCGWLCLSCADEQAEMDE